jgi:hypothetical protein
MIESYQSAVGGRHVASNFRPGILIPSTDKYCKNQKNVAVHLNQGLGGGSNLDVIPSSQVPLIWMIYHGDLSNEAYMKDKISETDLQKDTEISKLLLDSGAKVDLYEIGNYGQEVKPHLANFWGGIKRPDQVDLAILMYNNLKVSEIDRVKELNFMLNEIDRLDTLLQRKNISPDQAKEYQPKLDALNQFKMPFMSDITVIQEARKKEKADKLKQVADAEIARKKQEAEEQNQLAAADVARKKQEAIERKQVAVFRKTIKEGDESNCGPVIETKEKLVKVSFGVANYGNEHWIRRDQIFPSGYGCTFINGQYQPPQ